MARAEPSSTGGSGNGARTLLCPSAQPDMPGAQVLGVVTGPSEEPVIAYLDEAVPVTEALTELASPAHPADVMRFSAACEESKCCHFDGRRCQLAKRIVDSLPAVVESLPECLIRSECRWFQQEHRAACLRCPQVVTRNHSPSEVMTRVARVPLPEFPDTCSGGAEGDRADPPS
jgi:hypothetical protein